MMTFAAGQRWIYRAPEGFEASRLVIGAILKFDGGHSIVCCSVTGAPRRQAGGAADSVTIPFLPMTEQALRASVTSLDGTEEPPDSFAEKLQQWSDDPRGLTTFTVPFEGYLDRMIALQMAEIVGQSAA
ncbi:MAG TPA: hypothetical protein VJ045_09980 [Hyphomicrobiaceae bacterium]|nr:hypothetical protein [Hyphomicrobiaceae bacterium]